MYKIIKMLDIVRSFFSKKKAQEGMSVRTVVELVLAAIMIAGLAFMVITLIGIFSKSTQELDSTLNNYEELATLIKKIVEDKTETIEVSRTPLYISSGYSIIGFDRFQDYVIDQLNVKIYKPNHCKNKACICLYNNPPFYGKSDFDDQGLNRDKGVIKCTIYNMHIKFFSKGREYMRKHPDTFGMERDDITFPNAPMKTEYFVADGLIIQKLLGLIDLRTEWRIRNIQLKKTVYEKEIFLEISVVPDADQLRKEQIQEAAFELLQRFIDMPLPQTIDGLIIDPLIGGYEARRLLENHPELYTDKKYSEFIAELYTLNENKDAKEEVFKTVSYSMFTREVPQDKNSFSVTSQLFVDFTPEVDDRVNNYVADLSLNLATVDTNQVASITIPLNSNQNAVLSLYLEDIND